MEARAAGAARKQVSLLELRRSEVEGACVLSVLVAIFRRASTASKVRLQPTFNRKLFY